MSVSRSGFARAVLVLVTVGASACDDTDTTIQARLNGPSAFESRLFSVESPAVAPEFLASPSCRTLPPFTTRVNLIVNANRDLFLRRMRFEFFDRAGGRALPIAVPTHLDGPTASSALPVPIPTSTSVPTPGTLPFHGVALSPAMSVLGLRLNFDCGVPGEGTLVIDVETADRDGASQVSRLSVRIASSHL